MKTSSRKNIFIKLGIILVLTLAKSDKEVFSILGGAKK
jgi:hypothetical protein